MRLRHFCAIVFGALTLLGGAPALSADATPQSPEAIDKAIDGLPWVHGPATVSIGTEANIDIPKGAKYLDASSTTRFLELNGNPPSRNNYTIAPENLKWFSIFKFVDDGYVKDKEELDQTTMLKSIIDDQISSNERRKTLGLSSMYTDGWSVKPHYEPKSHNLEFGTEMHDEQGNRYVNYTSRLLGRGGFTTAVLVSTPKTLTADLPQYRTAVARFQYRPTKSYDDYQEGDKLAAYGLGALVTGGAAAVVVKSGVLAGLFAVLAKFGLAFAKIILIAAAAVFLAVANWVRRLFGRPPAES